MSDLVEELKEKVISCINSDDFDSQLRCFHGLLENIRSRKCRSSEFVKIILDSLTRIWMAMPDDQPFDDWQRELASFLVQKKDFELLERCLPYIYLSGWDLEEIDALSHVSKDCIKQVMKMLLKKEGEQFIHEINTKLNQNLSIDKFWMYSRNNQTTSQYSDEDSRS